MRIASIEALLRGENLQEVIDVAFRGFDLLEVPFRELKMRTAVKWPPVVRVVARERWCSGW